LPILSTLILDIAQGMSAGAGHPQFEWKNILQPSQLYLSRQADKRKNILFRNIVNRMARDIISDLENDFICADKPGPNPMP
jgi:hypothetical protein